MKLINSSLLSVMGLAFSGAVFAHATGNIALNNEGGQLVARSVDTGDVLNTTNVYQGYFDTEREWDERKIYDHVNANGTPVDASGNPAYTSASNPTPHLRGSAGNPSTKNPLYVVDDYAWNYYPNTVSLPVRPGTSGTVDNQNITLHLLADLKVWNGSTFVATGGENVNVSVWEWTRTADDGVTDVYDNYRFPDGGWYAYPVNPVNPNGSDASAGTYEFAPGDHYHWLFELTADGNGNRDAGAYLLNVYFSTATSGVGSSTPVSLLIANGLGADLAASVQHPDYVAAQNALTAVPLPGAVWLFGSALFGFAGIRRKSV